VTLRIGLDVGGTNTDAVLLDGDSAVIARHKTPTTPDPAEGVEHALAAVLPADPSAVATVTMGTTHTLNAVIRRRGLGRVTVLRLAAPATRSVPPFAGWPEDLRASVSAGAWIVAGGVEVDGRRHPLDPDEIRRTLERAHDVDGVAITGPFSLQDPTQELEAEALVEEVLGVPTSLGHRVGGVGLLERENAAILNAALARAADEVVDGFVRALRAHGLTAGAFLTQNDGTMMGVERARRVPVLTIGSGPSNSIRGAAALTGLRDGLVIDVGGTSTDVGAIAMGFPRESAVGVEIGGVATNFRMPDVVSVAVGGGTIIDPDGRLTLDSVGAALAVEGVVFGGATPTLSDAAVAAGRASMGDPTGLAGATWPRALEEARARVEGAIERMKLARGDVPAVVVGGGSVLLPEILEGISGCARPDNFDVANAIGAAIAVVSGEAERVAEVGDDRSAATDAVVADARARAIAAGADPDALEVVWIDEVPLAYMDRPLSRLRAKVAGPPSP
jgi:N-methylhydantoinase A/oxoprolinase/acetone carboxylase beta subunit